MRTSVHRNTRLRPVAPVRRVLAVAMAFLMLMASLPMDAVASVLDRATTRRVISETMPDGSVFDYEY
ncbi:MAG: hypothetical protein MJ202_02930, partial [Lentisphaeria bacterium]|nr:hypothetical protein [Lentisphaeria bacterium]